MKKAGNLLARRAYSRGEMRARLIALAGETAVESVLDRLEQLNLLNDADYAYNFAFRRTQHDGWGPAKVREALRRRGVSPATIDRALERIRNEGSADSTLEALLERYFETHGMPANPKDIQKLMAHFQRRGFDEDAVRGVLRHRMPAAALRRFETGE